MLNPPYLLHPDLILSIQLLPSKILRPAKKHKTSCQGTDKKFAFLYTVRAFYVFITSRYDIATTETNQIV